VSGSPFLFLLTVEFLVYDSSYQFCDRYTLLFCSLLQRRLLRFAEVEVGSIHGHDAYSTSASCRLQRCFRLLKPALPRPNGTGLAASAGQQRTVFRFWPRRPADSIFSMYAVANGILQSVSPTSTLMVSICFAAAFACFDKGFT
jgi:hypothetical protein